MCILVGNNVGDWSEKNATAFEAKYEVSTPTKVPVVLSLIEQWKLWRREHFRRGGKGGKEKILLRRDTKTGRL